MIAEFLFAGFGVILIYVLQWGRDHVIAEFNDYAAHFIYAAKLQWGRDHVIAEFEKNLGRRLRDNGFNGAAIM